jgi:hypothetical protein
MTGKENVLLAVLIDTAQLQWHVAGIRLDGTSVPLMRSEPENLRPYIGVPFDEQVNFLRHRLSGVLQRGCDRLWGRNLKPKQIVFLVDGPFIQAPSELTKSVAEHFVTWMTRPPVVFLEFDATQLRDGTPRLDLLAGEYEPETESALHAGLSQLHSATADSGLWELSQSKPKDDSELR